MVVTSGYYGTQFSEAHGLLYTQFAAVGCFVGFSVTNSPAIYYNQSYNQSVTNFLFPHHIGLKIAHRLVGLDVHCFKVPACFPSISLYAIKL